MALLPGKNKNAPAHNPEAQMELVEHLSELRSRILRSIVYVLVGMVLTYNLFDQIFVLLSYPLAPILHKVSGHLVYNSIQDAFLLRMQVCLVSGLAAAIPFVILELWGFVAPALTPEERKPVRYLAPFSVLLFIAGIVTAYAALPTAYGWMASYVPDVRDTALFQNVQQYLLLTVKLLLAFGIAFQLPIILLFLARVGLITADLMQKYWRHATVGIATAAAILTPSNDPLTMLMMAIPMAGLYLLSIGLVRAFEPRSDGVRSGPSLGTMIAVALAPVSILVAAGFWLWRVSPMAHADRAVIAASPPAPQQQTSATPPAPVVSTPPAADIDALRHQIDTLQKRVDALEAAKAAGK